MNRNNSEIEQLFIQVLISKVDPRADYLEIPDNNCFCLCLNEIIKNLLLNIDKVNNDYCNLLVENFYNFLIEDDILKELNPAIYGTLLVRLKDYMDSKKISKKELYGFLQDIRKRNALNYYFALYNKVELLLNQPNIVDIAYSVKIFKTYINEIIARGVDIRFLSNSIKEYNTNETFLSFIDFVKYIGSIKPFNCDVLDIYMPIKIGEEKNLFINICNKREQKYEIKDGVFYCKLYSRNTNDYFSLIKQQMVRISSIFDLIKLYTKDSPRFDEEYNILITSKTLQKDFSIKLSDINIYNGNKPYAKHLDNTIASLEKAKENDEFFYHKVLNTLSYAEKSINNIGNSAYVDTWIALETLCSIPETKSGYEAVQYYVPKMLLTKFIRQNLTYALINAYKNYHKDLRLENYLETILQDDYKEKMDKIPNIYYKFVLFYWAEILRNPKELYNYVCKLQSTLKVDILRIYILRNEYVHACNVNAFQTLEFYKLKSIFNNIIDEFFRGLTNRNDKSASRFGIGFDIFSQFQYKWEIMIQSLKLMFEPSTYSYKSDTVSIKSHSVNLKIDQNSMIGYNDYLLNLLKNNNSILKKYYTNYEENN